MASQWRLEGDISNSLQLYRKKQQKSKLPSEYQQQQQLNYYARIYTRRYHKQKYYIFHQEMNSLNPFPSCFSFLTRRGP